MFIVARVSSAVLMTEKPETAVSGVFILSEDLQAIPPAIRLITQNRKKNRLWAFRGPVCSRIEELPASQRFSYLQDNDGFGADKNNAWGEAFRHIFLKRQLKNASRHWAFCSNVSPFHVPGREIRALALLWAQITVQIYWEKDCFLEIQAI